jgi:hypothetical protein
LSARAADIDQAYGLRGFPKNGGNAPQAPGCYLIAAFEFASGGLVEIFLIKLCHGFTIARGARIAHELSAVRTTPQRAFRQIDAGL